MDLVRYLMASRVGNLNNLENQSRYDIMIFDFPDGYPVGGINLGFGKTPKRISGIQKVSQVFVKALMTSLGSDVVNNTRGTGFPGFTGTHNIQTTNDSEAVSILTAAVQKAEEQAKSTLNNISEGRTSQLESAQLINVEQKDDYTSVNIRILTRAGETAPIALPFTSLGIQVNA